MRGPEPRAYAESSKAVSPSTAAAQQSHRFTEANTLFDTWIGHFDLGRAYLESGTFAAGRFRVRPLHREARRGALVSGKR